MSDWRPIETAPRDGTDFLGVNARIGAGPYICHWQEGSGEVVDLEDDLARAEALDTWHGWMGRDFFANPRWLTHWMPLPELPR